MIDSSKPLWQLTVGEFLELTNELTTPTMVPSAPADEMYFSPNETLGYLLAKNIKLSITTLYRWRKDKVLEADKIGGLLAYKKSDLDLFINHKKNQE
jgi:hypothetical protein